HLDTARTLDHMIISQDVTVVINDDTRSDAVALVATTIAEELAEDVVEGIVPVDDRFGRDVDHARHRDFHRLDHRVPSRTFLRPRAWPRHRDRQQPREHPTRPNPSRFDHVHFPHRTRFYAKQFKSG